MDVKLDFSPDQRDASTNSIASRHINTQVTTITTVEGIKPAAAVLTWQKQKHVYIYICIYIYRERERELSSLVFFLPLFVNPLDLYLK